MRTGALDRRELLQRYGAAYAREHFAVIWTDAIDGDAGRRVTATGWPQAKPLPAADRGAFAAGLFAVRGQTRNPAVTARASGLLIVETDTAERLAEVEALALPPTWTVRSSAPYRQHRYFRWPEGITPEIVSFRFEPTTISGDREHYYLVPPALHRSGTVYDFLPGLSPDDLPIATLPEHSYRALVNLAGIDDQARDADSPAATPPPTPDLPAIFAARDEAELDRLLEDEARARRATAYGAAVLADQLTKIRRATPPGRHTLINKAAYIIGGYLDTAGLDRAYVDKQLEAAARVAFDGYQVAREAATIRSDDEKQTLRSIKRGLDAGRAEPREIPERAA